MTDQTTLAADDAVRVLSRAGAMCGVCGDEPGDQNCPDCDRVRRGYVEALRAAGWTPAAPLPVSEARTRLLQALDASYCQALGHTPEGLLAAYEASRTQTVDRAALRETLRRVLAEADGFSYDSLEPHDYQKHVDGVLAAVLPATTNHDTDTGATPPPALTEEGRLRARVQVLEEDAERDQGLAKVGARCMRDGHQGQIESGRAIVEGHRFALSVKLNLGTGATWDAIHERVADLSRVADTVTGPVCKDAAGCHRVVPCEPGCGTRDLLAEATRPLPAPVDRAAVLRDFVRELGDRLLGCCQECNACAAIARDLAAEMAESDAELRRVADETAATETQSDRAATRAAVLNEQGPEDHETLAEAAAAYRWLRPVIEATMTDPSRWDGDESEEFHLGRYVQWLAAQAQAPVTEAQAERLATLTDCHGGALHCGHYQEGDGDCCRCGRANWCPDQGVAAAGARQDEEGV